MKIDFGFVPFPREIWEKPIDLTTGEFRLLGWFLYHLKLGIQQRTYTDKQILSGVDGLPGLLLSRNHFKEAREGLQRRGFIQVEPTDRDGKNEYLLTIGKVSQRDNKVSERDNDFGKSVSERDTCNTNKVLQSTDTDIFSLSAPPSRVEPSKKPKKSDPRHQPFKELIFKYYERWNKRNPVWNGREAKALFDILASDPNLTADTFTDWLFNREQSEGVNLADRPGVFLEKLTSYAAGPLDRYGKPLESA